MNVIVVGCGRMGASLADRLYQKGYLVTVIDMNERSFADLPADFRGRTIEGDALNEGILHRAGVEQADALAVVTNSDAVNLAVCHTARSRFGLKEIAARNYEPRMQLLYEVFGIPVISTSVWAAQRMEEMLTTGLPQALLSVGDGKIDIYEFTIPAAWNGKRLADLLIEQQCSPVAMMRGGETVLVNATAPLETGDVVYVGSTASGIESIRKRLTAAS